MVAYWKPPTSERRGRRDFAEDTESQKIHRFSLRPLRMAVHFSRGACRGAALIEYLTIIREQSLKTMTGARPSSASSYLFCSDRGGATYQPEPTPRLQPPRPCPCRPPPMTPPIDRLTPTGVT